MVTQICTNKEQSVRLIAVGINPYTADCFLHRIMETDDWSDENVQEQIIESWMYKPGVLDIDSHYPAWSLSKLIEMMPPCIEGRGTLYLCAGLHTKRYNADNRTKDHQYSVEFGVNYTSGRYDNPFSALIDTIELLIKDGHFNDKYLVQKGGIK